MVTPEHLQHALTALAEAESKFPALTALRGLALRELDRLTLPQTFVFRWLDTGRWRLGYADDPVTVSSGLKGLHALNLAVTNPDERIPALHFTAKGSSAALRTAITRARVEILQHCPPLYRVLLGVSVDDGCVVYRPEGPDVILV